MKLYRVLYEDGGLNRAMFYGTQAEAKAGQKALEADVGYHNVDPFEPIEVPTDKQGLILWLNEYATGVVPSIR